MVLATAISELRMEMDAIAVTEKLVNDKCMEVTGRLRQQGYNVMIREPMEKPNANRSPTSTTTRTRPTPRTSPPATTRTPAKENAVIKGATPKASAVKEPKDLLKEGTAALANEEVKTPVHLSNEESHQSLHEIALLRRGLEGEVDRGGRPSGPDGDGGTEARVTALRSRVGLRHGENHDTRYEHNVASGTEDRDDSKVPTVSRERLITSTLKRALAKGSALLLGSILADAVALTLSTGAAADVVQYGGPPSLSHSLVDCGYQSLFYKPEEFQKFENETMNANGKVIWTSFTMRAHLQRTFQRETAAPNQVRNHERALRRERKELHKIAGCLARSIQSGSDVVLEMPARLHQCWQDVAYLKDVASEHGVMVYDFKIHGCAFGMTCNGVPVRKLWRILTTSEAIRIALERGCPGHPDHVEDHGGCSMCSEPRWYPEKLRKRIVDAIIWTLSSKHQTRSMAADVETELLEQQWFSRKFEHDPGMAENYALSRQRFPAEAPAGRKLEEVRQLLLRLHRSSGHTSFTAISKLLARRGAPS